MTWKRPKPQFAGPWGALPQDRPIGQPDWVRWDSKIPSVGPSSSRAPYRGLHTDAREQAYRRYCERISSAWRDHRRPAVRRIEGES